MAEEPVRVSRKKALGKGLDLLISDDEVESLGLVEARSATDNVDEVETGNRRKTLVDDVIKDPDRIEVDWTKERNVPIHELVIKHDKKKKKN